MLMAKVPILGISGGLSARNEAFHNRAWILCDSSKVSLPLATGCADFRRTAIGISRSPNNCV